MTRGTSKRGQAILNANEKYAAARSANHAAYIEKCKPAQAIFDAATKAFQDEWEAADAAATATWNAEIKEAVTARSGSERRAREVADAAFAARAARNRGGVQ